MEPVEGYAKLVNDGWKWAKLYVWTSGYGKKAEEWLRLTLPIRDDRRLYIATYHRVYEALLSLPVDPLPWVRSAIDRKFNHECETLDEIIDYFEEQEAEDGEDY